MKMSRKIYTAEQAERVKQELIPYNEKYVDARRKGIRFPWQDKNKLLSLCVRLTDYYVKQRIWDSYDAFENAMDEIHPERGVGYKHMMSVAIRIVKIKGQRRDPSANKLFFRKSRDMPVKSGLDEIR